MYSLLYGECTSIKLYKFKLKIKSLGTWKGPVQVRGSEVGASLTSVNPPPPYRKSGSYICLTDEETEVRKSHPCHPPADLGLTGLSPGSATARDTLPGTEKMPSEWEALLYPTPSPQCRTVFSVVAEGARAHHHLRPLLQTSQMTHLSCSRSPTRPHNYLCPAAALEALLPDRPSGPEQEASSGAKEPNPRGPRQAQ